MKKKLLIVCLFLSVNANVLLAQSNLIAGGNNIDKQSTRSFVPGQVIVKFKSENSFSFNNSNKSRSFQQNNPTLDSVLQKIGAVEVKPLLSMTNSKMQRSKKYSLQGKDKESISDKVSTTQIYVLKFDSDRSVEKIIDLLQTSDEVEYAEPNYIAKICVDYTSEPRYNEQWGLDAIRMPELWQIPVKNSHRPVIAILDTGVETTHPDLAANIWNNEDEVKDDTDSDENGFTDDVHGWNFIDNNGNVADYKGHGTHCAGIAAAVGNNNEGICGANPDALIMPIKVMDDEGYGTVEWIIQGLDYAVTNGADVISMSFNIPEKEKSEALEDMLEIASSYAILFASAGNNNFCIQPWQHSDFHGNSDPYDFEHIGYPATSKYVFGVMATNEAGQLASFSNFDCDGPLRSLDPGIYDTNLSDNQSYELKAPGENILSTYIGGGYTCFNGTSMACPMAAGAVSRLLQCRDYTREELLKALVYTSGNNIDIMAAYQVTEEELSATTFTIEHNGVIMTFVKTGEGTCQLGNSDQPAIDVNTRGAVEIPEEVHGLSVSGVASNAFRGCQYVTEIVIPFNVSGFGRETFKGCSSLEKLYLKGWTQGCYDYYDNFDETTYNSCTLYVSPHYSDYYRLNGSWKHFAHQDILPYQLGNKFYEDIDGERFPFVVTGISPKTVRLGVFGFSSTDYKDPSYKNTKTEIVFSSYVKGYAVTSITKGAFAGVEWLKKVELPPTLHTIEEDAFFCAKGLKTVNIPEGVEVIGKGAFAGCSALTTVNIPSTTYYVGEGAFQETGLTSFHFPDKYMERIPASLLYRCKDLKHVTIPRHTKVIGFGAFAQSGLENIILPEQIEYIESWAFNECTSLKSIEVQSPTPPFFEDMAFSDYSIPLKVPKGSEDAYRTDPNWGQFTNIIGVDSTIVSVYNYTRVYGEENPEFEYSSSGTAVVGIPEIICEATPKSSVGTYPIIVSRGSIEDENVNYVNGTITITKAPLTIAAGKYYRERGRENPDFRQKLTYIGLKNGETAEVFTKQPVVTTEATKESPVGRYTVFVNGAEAENYKISYLDGLLTIIEADSVKITANSYTRVYGDQNPVFNFTSNGSELIGTPEISCEATPLSPVGTYTIEIKKGSIENYNDSYVNGTLTITKAPLTIKVGNYTIKQGEPLPPFVISYSGFKNNEEESVLDNLPVATTIATPSSKPGKYTIKISGAKADNYRMIYIPGKLTVEADSVTIIANSYSREYGDENPIFGYTSTGATLIGSPEIYCEATPTSPVGVYPIHISKGSVENDNDDYIDGTLTITKAPLSIRLGTYTKEQGEDNPDFDFIYEGFKNYDTSANLDKLPVASTLAGKDSPVGDYIVYVSGAESKNYEISYIDGELTILDPVGLRSITKEQLDDNAVIYNVFGQRLTKLQRGVNIINRKKVIVK